MRWCKNHHCPEWACPAFLKHDVVDAADLIALDERVGHAMTDFLATGGDEESEWAVYETVVAALEGTDHGLIAQDERVKVAMSRWLDHPCDPERYKAVIAAVVAALGGDESVRNSSNAATRTTPRGDK